GRARRSSATAPTSSRRNICRGQRLFPRSAIFMKLKMSGLGVALASSCKASEMPVYERLADIEDIVDSKTCCDDVDRSKPEPDIFEAMLRRLGVRSDEAI